jgi:hypothetical protein
MEPPKAGELKDTQGLREQFDRDGSVEVGVNAVKATTYGAVVVLAFAVATAVAWAINVWLGVLLALFSAYAIVAVGLLFLDQVFGKGPALRVDRASLTIRRWSKPLVLAWDEVCLVLPRPNRGRGGPQVAILMSQWVWHDYRVARPAWLRVADRFTHYRGRYLVLLKILDHSAAEILTFLDKPTIDRLTRLEPPYRLVLDYGEDGESPLWMRGGREAPVRSLPLSPALMGQVEAWNRRLVAIAENDAPLPPGTELQDDGRALASQIQAELGLGSQVLSAPDVPLLGASTRLRHPSG